MKPVPAIVESAFDPVFARVRTRFSALREAEIQAEKSEARSVKSQRIAVTDREAVAQRRIELGRDLAEARKAWPERGPKAKGWGEFLEREGLSQPTAWRYMEDAREADGGVQVSFSDGRLNESPHPVETSSAAGEGEATPPREPLRKVLDMQLFLGRWEDILADAGQVDSMITDPPYSKRVHDSKPTRDDGSDDEGLSPNYDPWSPEDVMRFVEHWSPRTRGWMLCCCDDELIPAYRAAYERMGRVSFAPVPCVINGMSVRTRGDGPSSWAIYAMVARPSGSEFVRWGTLPGAYVGNRQPGAKHGRGKPTWLTDLFVQHYTRGSDLVCDPLAGYGGTLISALKQNRRAIGAEQDEKAIEEAFARANESQGITRG